MTEPLPVVDQLPATEPEQLPATEPEPLKAKNQRPKRPPVPEHDTRYCIYCEAFLPLDRFYNRKARTRICRPHFSQQVQRSKKRAMERKREELAKAIANGLVPDPAQLKPQPAPVKPTKSFARSSIPSRAGQGQGVILI